MIGYVQGRLAEAWDGGCLVATQGGVGYRVMLPRHVALPEKGAPVAFYTSMAVRENAIELFGFDTFEERQAFEILRGVSKIGGRIALAILSAHRPDDLARIVADADIGALARVPGIGRKTAQHLLLELQHKLRFPQKPLAGAAQPTGLRADVLAALLNLGYEESECGPVVAAVVDAEPDLDVAGAIRMALKNLAKGRA